MSFGSEEREVRFMRPASLPGTELKIVDGSTRRWRGINERYAIAVGLEIAASVRYRGVQEEVRDGTLVVHEPGEAFFTTATLKPATFKVLYIDTSVVAQLVRDLGYEGRYHFRPMPIDDPDLFRLACRLCRAIENDSEPLDQQNLLVCLIAGLAKHADRPPQASALRSGRLAVARGKAYLSEHYGELVSLDELARVSGVSRFTLVRAFTREVGLSPHAYHLHLRVEHARALLQHGVSPANAAMSMGFADQSHFTRHFKRVLQVTPSHYAARTFVSGMQKRSCPSPCGLPGRARQVWT